MRRRRWQKKYWKSKYTLYNFNRHFPRVRSAVGKRACWKNFPFNMEAKESKADSHWVVLLVKNAHRCIFLPRIHPTVGSFALCASFSTCRHPTTWIFGCVCVAWPRLSCAWTQCRMSLNSSPICPFIKHLAVDWYTSIHGWKVWWPEGCLKPALPVWGMGLKPFRYN